MLFDEGHVTSLDNLDKEISELAKKDSGLEILLQFLRDHKFCKEIMENTNHKENLNYCNELFENTKEILKRIKIKKDKKHSKDSKTKSSNKNTGSKSLASLFVKGVAGCFEGCGNCLKGCAKCLCCDDDGNVDLSWLCCCCLLGSCGD
uniref:Uncharacterized protein n=1 Tax=Meloidogyne hapla TaxID=6305 RepID=A0A1I8B580_MELHA